MHQEYAIFRARSTEGLEMLVNRALNEGWRLHAGPVVAFDDEGSVVNMYQAMVKGMD